MKLYLNGIAHDVALFQILTQSLYDKVTPILEKLANSKGAKSAFESMLQKRMLKDEYFVQMANRVPAGETLSQETLQKDFKFQEIVGETLIKIKSELFEHINVDNETIPIVFELAQVCIDKKNIHNAELIAGIDSEPTSEFWQNQDIDGVLEALTKFRATILRRIKSGI